MYEHSAVPHKFYNNGSITCGLNKNTLAGQLEQRQYAGPKGSCTNLIATVLFLIS